MTPDFIKYQQNLTYLKLLLALRSKDYVTLELLISNHPLALEDLLKNGSLLHQPFVLNDVNLLNYLIEKGMNINSTNASGNTPLMQCVLFDKDRALSFLLKKGASIAHQNKDFKSALDLAYDCYNPKIIDLLQSKGAVVNYPNDIHAQKAFFRPQLQKPMHYVKYIEVDNFWKYLRYGFIAGTILAAALMGVPYWGMLILGFAVSMVTQPFVQDDVKEIFIKRERYQNQNGHSFMEALKMNQPYIIRDAALRRHDSVRGEQYRPLNGFNYANFSQEKHQNQHNKLKHE